jgi:putative membrane protein insertion efficiency factor
VGLLLAMLAAADLSRAPDRQRSARVLRAGIHGYQRFVSPRMSAMGVRCKFTLTCSRYADAAIARHGALGGSWLSVRRVARCGPWTPQGTVDPVP